MLPNLTVLPDTLFSLGVGYLLLSGLYLNFLVLAARRYRPLMAAGQPTTPMTLVIPAHDEATTIATTLRWAAELDYPPALLRTVVIADNCTDDTAAVARQAGAEVWERSDPERPGKGAALRWMMEQLPPALPGDALAVLDADSIASPNWLRRADAYLRSGNQAVQSFYGISNPEASWRARLMGGALLLFHHVRSAGRDASGWSAGLKGNGMVFSRRLLERVPWAATSITEDLEYASMLAAHGVRVAYDGGSHVLGPAGVGRAARGQRLRWEGGRFGVAGRWAMPLLALGIRRRSAIPLDAAAELLVLPLGLLTLLGIGLTVATAAATRLTGMSGAWLTLAVLALLLIGSHVVGGLWVARAPAALYRTLLLAPLYLGWKVAVYGWLLLGVQRHRWVRTDRTPGPSVEALHARPQDVP